MEEGEKRTSNIISASHTSPISSHTANGKSAGIVKKVSSPTQRGGSTSSTGDGFMDVAAKIMSSKAKGKGSPRDSSDKRINKNNGCDDDLPLGSEAHSLSLDYVTNAGSKYPLPEDKRSKWQKTTSQGLLSWQSFNSDASNQTSASSASLEQLLNDRQVDPEEMLLSLGFGGVPQSLMPSLTRVPERFLNHPSRAYGIAPAGLSEEDVEDMTDAAASLPDRSASAASTAAGMSPARKRSGIWTLARTLSLLRLKTNLSRGHISSSSNSSGTQPLNNQLVSILHPANQRYLASRGFYEKQGWPKGSFAEPEDDSLHAVKEEVESKDAASKRKIFKKTRPQRNWSICDSEENEVVSGGREWISKSVDDYQSLAGQDDSLGRGTYFSTTTESSTDSLDTPNLETERAFESIRREYEKSRQDRLSSDDLFLPSRKKRLSSEVMDNDNSLGLDHGLDLLGSNIAGTNYFVSPASSRQTTVEKAPTICDRATSVHFSDDGVDSGDVGMRMEVSRSEGHGQVFTDQASRKDNLHHTEEDEKGDVRIIISSSESREGRHWSQGGKHSEQNGKSSRLTVKGTQTASSDSGSSSTTAVGSSSSTVTADKPEPRHPSESENSITDWDSISRTNNLNGFNQNSNMVSSSCQTADTDFSIAVAANQNSNVKTLSTSNKSILFVRINESEFSSTIQDRKREDYAVIQQSPKVQLSAFPPTINHLELMKRLQHSQNELSRMGSVQSDSSGFGDADPALDPDGLKQQASLGSSLESCKTLASSATTVILSKLQTKDIATQTQQGSDQIPREVKAGIESSHGKLCSKPTDHYVTMCYIPTLTSKTDQPIGIRNKTRVSGGSHQSTSYQDRPPLAAPLWRSRSGSDPRHSSLVYSDGLDSRRPWLRNTDHSHGNRPHNIRTGNHRGFESGRSLSYAYPQSHSDSPNLHKHTEPHRQTAHSTTIDLHPRSGRDTGSSKRTFTSQIDLFTNTHGFSTRGTSFDSHSSDSNVGLRRFSDEGILDGRNNAPLSLELALARTSGNKLRSLQHSTSSTAKIISTRNTGLTSYDPTLATPTESQTEGFQFSLIAGNISGLNSQLVSDKPIDSSITPRSAFRQRSCDILDDDFEDKDSVVTQSHSRMSDDLDAGSPVTENSSEFSVQSAPEGQSHIKTGILESRKLAKLINQPIHFMRLHEENRLLQAALQKYKTELTILEASLMVDCQAAYSNMTDPEKEELEELVWLWNEVRGQVIEMEHILMYRIKAVHAGNELYSLISSLGVTSRMVELIKEQICQQQLASSRTEEASMDEDTSIFGSDLSYHDGRHYSLQGSQSWLTGMGYMSRARPSRRFQSSSTSNLSHEFNLSLEQIKSSVLSQVQGEIKENTKKLEQDLQEKDREIKKLQEQLLTRSLSLPDQQPKRWTPRSSLSRSHRVIIKSRPSKVKERTSQETDV